MGAGNGKTRRIMLPSSTELLQEGDFVLYRGTTTILRVKRVDYDVVDPTGQRIVCYFVEHPSGVRSFVLDTQLHRVPSHDIEEQHWLMEQTAFARIKEEALKLKEENLKALDEPPIIW